MDSQFIAILICPFAMYLGAFVQATVPNNGKAVLISSIVGIVVSFSLLFHAFGVI